MDKPHPTSRTQDKQDQDPKTQPQGQTDQLLSSIPIHQGTDKGHSDTHPADLSRRHQGLFPTLPNN